MGDVTIISERVVDDGFNAYFIAWYQLSPMQRTWGPTARPDAAVLTMRWFSDLTTHWEKPEHDGTKTISDRDMKESVQVAWMERDRYFLAFKEAVWRRQTGRVP